MISTIKTAFTTSLRHWKIVLLVYALQLLVAVPLAMQVWHVLEASIGNSLEINKLLPAYDHTVFSDFLNTHGGSITPLIGQLRWVLLVWAVASIFINGGVLFTLLKRTPKWQDFWAGGAAYFFRFAKIAAIFLLLVLLWTAITLLPYLGNLMNSFETMDSEKTVLTYLLWIAMGWFIGVIYLNNAFVVARTAIIEQGLGTWRALKTGLGFALRHFFQITTIFLIFSALQVLASLVYWWVEGKSGMVSGGMVLVFFLIQQALVLFRIAGRFMVLDGISSFFVHRSQSR
ncbi:MAG: hypothetical protein MUC59_14115 [Saprospiraceae bacterium]|nr:hypothetical protein [Saprospiraceae bacterium]